MATAVDETEAMLERKRRAHANDHLRREGELMSLTDTHARRRGEYGRRRRDGTLRELTATRRAAALGVRKVAEAVALCARARARRPAREAKLAARKAELERAARTHQLSLAEDAAAHECRVAAT